MNYTDITFLIDRSGSMTSIKEDAMGGFETFIKEQKEAEINACVSVYKFDNIFEKEYVSKDIKEVKSFNLSPRGSTALLDSIAKAIIETEVRLSKLETYLKPDRTLFIIITDGYENSSIEFKKDQIAQLIDKKQKEDWQFVFLGANMDAIKEGMSFNIPKGCSMTYTHSGEGIRSMFNKLSSSNIYYCQSQTVGNVDNYFREEDEAK